MSTGRNPRRTPPRARSPNTLRERSARGRLCCGHMSRPRALVLYREILRTMQKWPSKRRDKVSLEIRQEFRENMHEASADRQRKMLEEAEAGLRSLRQQCGLSDGTDVTFAADAELSRRYRPG